MSKSGRGRKREEEGGRGREEILCRGVRCRWLTGHDSRAPRELDSDGGGGRCGVRVAEAQLGVGCDDGKASQVVDDLPLTVRRVKRKGRKEEVDLVACAYTMRPIALDGGADFCASPPRPKALCATIVRNLDMSDR